MRNQSQYCKKEQLGKLCIHICFSSRRHDAISRLSGDITSDIKEQQRGYNLATKIGTNAFAHEFRQLLSLHEPPVLDLCESDDVPIVKNRR